MVGLTVKIKVRFQIFCGAGSRFDSEASVTRYINCCQRENDFLLL